MKISTKMPMTNHTGWFMTLLTNALQERILCMLQWPLYPPLVLLLASALYAKFITWKDLSGSHIHLDPLEFLVSLPLFTVSATVKEKINQPKLVSLHLWELYLQQFLKGSWHWKKTSNWILICHGKFIMWVCPLGLGNRFEIQNRLIGMSFDSIIDSKSILFSTIHNFLIRAFLLK